MSGRAGDGCELTLHSPTLLRSLVIAYGLFAIAGRCKEQRANERRGVIRL